MKHADELLKTCEGVVNLPPKSFNMQNWQSGQSNGHCGTACCFIGWLPTFAPKTGLRLVREDYSYENDKGEHVEGFDASPHFGNQSGEDAVATYFDISPSDVERLFMQAGHPTPQAVASKVRKFIAKKLKEKKSVKRKR